MGKSIHRIGPSAKYRLLMFAHPLCDCTEASLDELAYLTQKTGPRLEARLFVYQPSRPPKDWAHSNLIDRARQIPGVSIETDIDGSEAKRHGAVTSGQVYLYKPDGSLAYSGGITATRGRSGDNLGVEAILDWVSKGHGVGYEPVFGCAIVSDK